MALRTRVHRHGWRVRGAGGTTKLVPETKEVRGQSVHIYTVHRNSRKGTQASTACIFGYQGSLRQCNSRGLLDTYWAH